MPANTAKEQDWWQPYTGGEEAGKCSNVNASPFCTNCNTNQSEYGCHKDDPCPECNTMCTSCQSYCQLGKQLIINHGTVNEYRDPACMAKDEFIFRNWTAKYWNTLQRMLLTADKMGETQTQNANVAFPNGPAAPDPRNETHIENSLITAKKYNDVVTALGKFSSNSEKVVGVSDNGIGDVIKGDHAKAISSGYKAAKFKMNVCDICNGTGFQHASCSCNSACNCSCGCSSGGRG